MSAVALALVPREGSSATGESADEGCGCSASSARPAELSLLGEGKGSEPPSVSVSEPRAAAASLVERRADPARLSGHRNDYVLLPGGYFKMGTDKPKILPVSRTLLVLL